MPGAEGASRGERRRREDRGAEGGGVCCVPLPSGEGYGKGALKKIFGFLSSKRRVLMHSGDKTYF